MRMTVLYRPLPLGTLCAGLQRHDVYDAEIDYTRTAVHKGPFIFPHQCIGSLFSLCAPRLSTYWCDRLPRGVDHRIS